MKELVGFGGRVEVAILNINYNYFTHLAVPGLFLFALALFSIGINEPTGVTGKDEYYLALRTPMCMQEQQIWLIPCLDGQPRLRKPPLLYWLTRASFEIFGTNLTSARFVAVTFAAVLVLAITLIALEFGDSLGTAIKSGLIAMSCLGLAVGSRILEHDVPVAAWSALAFLYLLRWYQRQHFGYGILFSLCLTAGFLTKGPIVFIVCGAGLIAMLITDATTINWFRHHWREIIGITLFTIILTALWFIYVYTQYPNTSAAVLANELKDRRFPYFSLVPIYGTLLLSMPWGFIAGNIIARQLLVINENKSLRLRIIWFGFTLLPFFFIRSFERYLFGSLVPLVLLLTVATNSITPTWRAAARVGMIITLPIILLIQILAIVIAGPNVWLIINLLATSGFVYHWWQAYSIEWMAFSAAILWMCVIGLAYPRLGINDIPPQLLAQVKNQEIVLFNGPQPALLPAILGRSLVHVDGQWQLPPRLRQPCTKFLVLSEEFETDNALAGLKKLQFTATEQGRFGIFSSRVTWANLFRPGTTWAEIWNAMQSKHLSEIMPQVVLYQARNQCQVN